MSMRKVLLVEVAAILCLLIGSLGSAQACANSPMYTFDELGNGIWADGTVITGRCNRISVQVVLIWR